MEQPSALISVEGILETVIYSSEDTHYTVAKLRQDDAGCITIVGTIMATNEGEKLRLQGKWHEHAKYGRQFQVQQFEVVLPTQKDAIEKYLAAGGIKGIGPSLAARIANFFDQDTFQIFRNNPERLQEVSGIGKKKYQQIIQSWQSQRGVHDAMLFLSGYNIRGMRAVKIYKRYGGNLVSILKEHPYRLALDIDGIGFLTADRIAQHSGVRADDPERIQAALFHLMNEASSQGHCYYPQEKLLDDTVRMLNLDQSLVSAGLEKMIKGDYLRSIDCANQPIYLPHIYHYETKVADCLLKIAARPQPRKIAKADSVVSSAESVMGIIFHDQQRQAIRKALQEKICIITGGPGVGKTTIIKALVHILKQHKATIALAAPTGRAAKRLSEASDFNASTIHRLLRFNPHNSKFEYNQKNPLTVDYLIIDESSMIDIALAYHVLAAVPEKASLVLIGDADQLPSVGPGNFLSDLIVSGIVPVVRLSYIFRQSQGSSIVSVAHEINSGSIPRIINYPSSDIFFMPVESPASGAQLIVDLLTDRLPKKYFFHPCQDIQVLTPMYKGEVGADNLNRLLAEALNSSGRPIGNGRFREGDKVMQVVNNYEKDVYNGDIGIIRSSNKIDKTVDIGFDNRILLYQESELDEIVRAYAISIHKSQGSEYPAVIIPLFTTHYIMLERNLLYTAITRGKQLVVLVGNWRAFQIAVSTMRARNRYTSLASFLAEPRPTDVEQKL